MPLTRTADTPHPSGAIVHWAERAPENIHKVAFTCDGCKKKGFISGGRAREQDWSGLCNECRSKIKRSSPRKITGDEQHSSGTTIHWSEREPGQLSSIAITCYRCHEQGFLYHSWIKDSRWNGLCHSCVSKRGKRNPRKITSDQELPSGGSIFWSRRDDERVPVFCMPCNGEWSASIDVVKTRLSATRRQGQSWPGYCPKHSRGVAALLPLLASRPQNGSMEKKKTGPQKGQYAFITWSNMEQAFKKVDGFPTKAKVASALGVSESGIDKWLAREQVDWRQIQQRFINTY